MPPTIGQSAAGDQSTIKVSASALITILIAIIAANWGIFTLYMESKWSGIDSSISHANESMQDNNKILLAEIKLVKQAVETTEKTTNQNARAINTVTDRFNAYQLDNGLRIERAMSEVKNQLRSLEKDVLTIQSEHKTWIHGGAPKSE